MLVYGCPQCCVGSLSILDTPETRPCRCRYRSYFIICNIYLYQMCIFVCTYISVHILLSTCIFLDDGVLTYLSMGILGGIFLGRLRLSYSRCGGLLRAVVLAQNIAGHRCGFMWYMYARHTFQRQSTCDVFRAYVAEGQIILLMWWWGDSRHIGVCAARCRY